MDKRRQIPNRRIKQFITLSKCVAAWAIILAMLLEAPLTVFANTAPQPLASSLPDVGYQASIQEESTQDSTQETTQESNYVESIEIPVPAPDATPEQLALIEQMQTLAWEIEDRSQEAEEITWHLQSIQGEIALLDEAIAQLNEETAPSDDPDEYADEDETLTAADLEPEELEALLAFGLDTENITEETFLALEVALLQEEYAHYQHVQANLPTQIAQLEAELDQVVAALEALDVDVANLPAVPLTPMPFTGEPQTVQN